MRTLEFELIWLLLNFSSEEDLRVSEFILQPDFEILQIFGRILEGNNEPVKVNVLGCIFNYFGENSEEQTKRILNETQLYDFFVNLVCNCKMTNGMLEIIPWGFINLINCKVLQYETTQIVLRVLLKLHNDILKHQTFKLKKKEVLLSDVVKCIT